MDGKIKPKILFLKFARQRKKKIKIGRLVFIRCRATDGIKKLKEG
jgi:hypothetical protein